MTSSSGTQVLLALARMAMDASVRASGELGGPSPVQLRALTALRRMTGANLAQLAEEMGVTVSTTAGWSIGSSARTGCTARPRRTTGARSA